MQSTTLPSHLLQRATQYTPAFVINPRCNATFATGPSLKWRQDSGAYVDTEHTQTAAPYSAATRLGFKSGARYCPVWLASTPATFSGVPTATI